MAHLALPMVSAVLFSFVLGFLASTAGGARVRLLRKTKGADSAELGTAPLAGPRFESADVQRATLGRDGEDQKLIGTRLATDYSTEYAEASKFAGMTGGIAHWVSAEAAAVASAASSVARGAWEDPHILDARAAEISDSLSAGAHAHTVAVVAVSHWGPAATSAIASGVEVTFCRTEGEGGRRTGCLRDCACQWHHQCYSMHVQGHNETGENIGICELSLPSMMVISCLLFMITFVLTFLVRICLMAMDSEACKQIMKKKQAPVILRISNEPPNFAESGGACRL